MLDKGFVVFSFIQIAKELVIIVFMFGSEIITCHYLIYFRNI